MFYACYRKSLSDCCPAPANRGKGHDKTVSRYGENQRASHYAIFSRYIVPDFSPKNSGGDQFFGECYLGRLFDSTQLDRTPGTLCSRFSATLINTGAPETDLRGKEPPTKTARPPSFRNFVPKHDFSGYLWLNTKFIVERNHGPPNGGAASFHITRWTIVMRAAHSQAPAGQPAVAELCQPYWHPLRMFACVRRLLREEVCFDVLDPVEIDEEIHARCKTLIAPERQAGP